MNLLVDKPYWQKQQHNMRLDKITRQQSQLMPAIILGYGGHERYKQYKLHGGANMK